MNWKKIRKNCKPSMQKLLMKNINTILVLEIFFLSNNALTGSLFPKDLYLGILPLTPSLFQCSSLSVLNISIHRTQSQNGTKQKLRLKISWELNVWIIFTCPTSFTDLSVYDFAYNISHHNTSSFNPFHHNLCFMGIFNYICHWGKDYDLSRFLWPTNEHHQAVGLNSCQM